MKRKLIFSIIAVVLVLLIGIGSTVAYLSSIAGPLDSTFTVGDVKLELAETKKGPYNLAPGVTIQKDPIVTVKRGSEACYLYIKLEWLGGLESMVTYTLADGWYNLGGVDGVYFRAVEEAAVDMRYHVLLDDMLVIRDDVTKEKLATLGNEDCALIVTAYAIQMQDMESAADGWYNMLAALEE